jgi:hypothetical protein
MSCMQGCPCVSECVHVCVCVCVFVCVGVCVCVCVCVCIYIYIYVCMYVCIYIYIYILLFVDGKFICCFLALCTFSSMMTENHVGMYTHEQTNPGVHKLPRCISKKMIQSSDAHFYMISLFSSDLCGDVYASHVCGTTDVWPRFALWSWSN